MRKRHIHPIHVHGLSKSGNLRCFLPLYNSHPPKPEPCIFLYAPFTKEYFYRSSSRIPVALNQKDNETVLFSCTIY